MIAPTAARRVAGSLRRRYRDSALRWHLRNAREHVAYRIARAPLSAPAERAVAALDRDGVALLHVDELVAPAVTIALVDEVARREREAQVAGTDDGAAEAHYKSRYRRSLLGHMPIWNAESPFARFACAPAMVEVANAYFGLAARLRYYNVWHTFPVDDPPSDSQLWHRDREDRLILKGFLYLSDVREGAGPLAYIRGSHGKGRVHVTPARFKEPGHGNWRSRDDQMAAVIPRAQWFDASGPRGTLLLVDTAGYHKGGFAQTLERKVFTFMYTSPLADDCDMFDPSAPGPRY